MRIEKFARGCGPGTFARHAAAWGIAALIGGDVLGPAPGAASSDDAAAAECVAHDFMEAGIHGDRDAFLAALTEAARAVMSQGGMAPPAGEGASYKIGEAAIDDSIARVPMSIIENDNE